MLLVHCGRRGCQAAASPARAAAPRSAACRRPAPAAARSSRPRPAQPLPPPPPPARLQVICCSGARSTITADLARVDDAGVSNLAKAFMDELVGAGRGGKLEGGSLPHYRAMLQDNRRRPVLAGCCAGWLGQSCRRPGRAGWASVAAILQLWALQRLTHCPAPPAHPLAPPAHRPDRPQNAQARRQGRLSPAAKKELADFRNEACEWMGPTYCFIYTLCFLFRLFSQQN